MMGQALEDIYNSGEPVPMTLLALVSVIESALGIDTEDEDVVFHALCLIEAGKVRLTGIMREERFS